MRRLRKSVKIRLLRAIPAAGVRGGERGKAFSPRAPRHLKAAAKMAWKRVVKVIAPICPLDPQNVLPLELLATALSDFTETRRILKEQGSTYISYLEEGGRSVIRERPEVKIMKDAWSRIETMLPHFFVDPTSPEGVSVIEALKKED